RAMPTRPGTMRRRTPTRRLAPQVRRRTRPRAMPRARSTRRRRVWMRARRSRPVPRRSSAERWDRSGSCARQLRGERLGLLEQTLEQVEAPVPEARIGDVEPDRGEELLGRIRSARFEQREIARYERGSLLVVAPQQREYEELAERVRIAVERRVDEV